MSCGITFASCKDLNKIYERPDFRNYCTIARYGKNYFYYSPTLESQIKVMDAQSSKEKRQQCSNQFLPGSTRKTA